MDIFSMSSLMVDVLNPSAAIYCLWCNVALLKAFLRESLNCRVCLHAAIIATKNIRETMPPISLRADQKVAGDYSTSIWAVPNKISTSLGCEMSFR